MPAVHLAANILTDEDSYLFSSPIMTSSTATSTESDLIISTTLEPSVGLLDLPADLRHIVYSHLIESTGVIHVFAHYSIAKQSNPDIISLMHVNKLVRSEVKDCFYERQTFQFRSFEAMEYFCRDVGAHHAGLIKNILLSRHMCRRQPRIFLEQIPRVLRPFKSVNRIVCLGLKCRHPFSRANDDADVMLYDSVSILGVAYGLPLLKSESTVMSEYLRVDNEYRGYHTKSYAIELGTKDMQATWNSSTIIKDSIDFERDPFRTWPLGRRNVDFRRFEGKVKAKIGEMTSKKRKNLGVKDSEWNIVPACIDLMNDAE